MQVNLAQMSSEQKQLKHSLAGITKILERMASEQMNEAKIQATIERCLRPRAD